MVARQSRLLSALLKGSIGAIAGLFGLGLVVLIATNLATERQEVEIDREKAEFLKKYSYQRSNASALKLQHLAAQLGIPLEIANSGPASASKSEQQAFDEMAPQIDRYLEARVRQTGDLVDPLPPELSGYLQGRIGRMTTLRSYLRYYRVPNWGMDIGWLKHGDIRQPMPSFLGVVQLQKLLLLDAIAQSDLGNHNRVAANLEASWRLIESIQSRPELIAQLAHIRLVRNQLGVLRHVDNLSSHWQQRLAKHDYQRSMLRAIEGEFFFRYTVTQRFNPAQWQQMGEAFEIPHARDLAKWKWSGLPGSIYLRYVEGANYQAVKTVRDRVQNASVCHTDVVDLPDQQFIFQESLTPRPTQLTLQKAVQLQLETELTQKVLQAKAIAQKEGKLPRSLPPSTSSACPGLKWNYQFISDKEASIDLNSDLQLDETGAPLSYIAVFY